MNISQGFYLQRDGGVAEVQGIDDNTVWTIEGMDSKGEFITWTPNGFASSSYSHPYQNREPRFDKSNDLIKRISKEEYPEYFL